MKLVQRIGLLAVAALAGCGPRSPPTSLAIQGQSPIGKVKITEIIRGGNVSGDGTFDYAGIGYRFKVVGRTKTPAPDATIMAEGEVYGMNKLEQFTGRYIQGPGAPGMRGEASSQLWLQNQANVVLRLHSSDNLALPAIGQAIVNIPQLQ